MDGLEDALALLEAGQALAAPDVAHLALRTGLGIEVRHCHLHPGPGAVGPDPELTDPLRPGRIVDHQVGEDRVVIGMDPVRDARAHEVVERPAEELRDRWAGVDDDLVLVDQHCRVARALHQVPHGVAEVEGDADDGDLLPVAVHAAVGHQGVQHLATAAPDRESAGP